MGKRLTVCFLALCLAASLLCPVSAKESEISVEIDQTGQDLQSGEVYHLAILFGEIDADGSDAGVVDQEITTHETVILPRFGTFEQFHHSIRHIKKKSN